MVKQIFLKHKQFALLYFSMLLLDISVKLYCPPIPYRFISKPWLMLLLLGYFCLNKSDFNNRKNIWVFLALVLFLIGDVLNILNYNLLLGISLLFFSVGKIFLCVKFSHKKDFNISKLIPFTFIMFVYTIFIIGFLYDYLGVFLVPALVSFFLTLLMVQFSYLRQAVFNTKSYMLVFFGVVLYVLGEGLLAVELFKISLPIQDFFIMVLYGAGMYTIILGILNEKKCEEREVEKYDSKMDLH